MSPPDRAESIWPEREASGRRRRRVLLPQQETVESIALVVKHRNLELERVCEILGPEGRPVTSRIVGYYRTNARLLGFLDADGIATPEGRALAELDQELVVNRIGYAFEASEIGRAWLAFAGVLRLEELEPNTAARFVRAYYERHRHPFTGNETDKRRISTLTTWLSKFKHARVQLPLPSAARAEPAAITLEPVFASRITKGRLVALAQGARTARIATAYFSLGGYAVVADQLIDADMFLLIGADDRSRGEVNFILRSFAASLTERQTMPEGASKNRRRLVRRLHEQLVRGRIRVRHLAPKKQRGLHAKVYIFDTKRAYLGSANFTDGGLVRNIECGQTVTELPEVEYLKERFDHYFGRAKTFSEPLLRELERSWCMWGAEDPTLVLLRMLLTIFGKVPRIEGRRFELATYQRAIVATLLRRFESSDQILLVAPTGMGKTLIGAYVAACLRATDTISRVVVVAKNPAMRENWKDALRDFRIYNDTVRVYDLERYENMKEELDALQSGLGPTDLVVVDECHHFRRAEAHRQQALRSLMKGGPAGPPRGLFLTATPISKGWTDLQNLVDVLGGGRETLESPSDVAGHPRLINVSLGQILDRFGERQSRSVGLRIGESLRFFPRVRLRTVRYNNGMGPIFEALAEMSFELDSRAGLDEFAEGEEMSAPAVTDPQIPKHGFLRALLARRAESSEVALRATVGRLHQSVDAGTLAPTFPESFSENLHRLTSLLDKRRSAAKIKKLLGELNKLPPATKVLVFTEYKDTAHWLAAQLIEEYGPERVACVTGDTRSSVRSDLFRAFAPLAQRVEQMPDRNVAILVATDAISEGENLQDAGLVVNFDLPWTPLRIIQRVGRLNRFTKTPRDIRVLNFFPKDSSYESLLDHLGRLGRRSADNEELTGVDYVRTKTVTAETVQPEHALTPLIRKNRTVRLEQLLSELGDDIRNPLFERFWGATPAQVREANGLPDGIIGCGSGGQPGVLVLAKSDRDLLLLFQPDAGALEVAPHDESFENILSRFLDVPSQQPAIDIDRADDKVDSVLQEWSARCGEDREFLTVVAAIVITPLDP